MTTDAFTEAARAEAAERFPFSEGYEVGVYQRRGFVAGAAWARDRLAQQEPTDAECIHVLSVLGTDLGQPTRTDFEWSQAAIRRCREALIAARKARLVGVEEIV